MTPRLRFVALLGALLFALAPVPPGPKSTLKPRACPPHCPMVGPGTGGPVAPAASHSMRLSKVVANSQALRVHIRAGGPEVDPPDSSSTPKVQLGRFQAAARLAGPADAPPEAPKSQARILRRHSWGGTQADPVPLTRQTVLGLARRARASGGGIGAEGGGDGPPPKTSKNVYEGASKLLDGPSDYADSDDSMGRVAARSSAPRPTADGDAAGDPPPVAASARARGLNERPGPGYPGVDEPPPGGQTRRTDAVPVSGTGGPVGAIGGFTAPAHATGRPAPQGGGTYDLTQQILELAQARMYAVRDVRDLPDPQQREERIQREVQPLEVRLVALERELVRQRAARRDLTAALLEPVDMEIDEP